MDVYFWRSKKGEVPVKTFIKDLENYQKKKIARRLDRIENKSYQECYDAKLIKQISDDVYDDFYGEIKWSGTQLRVLIDIRGKPSSCFLLHGLLKKADVIPQQDKRKANIRSKNIIKNNCIPWNQKG
ncbi:MAG: hypothetical protein ABEJ02_01510 [Candidatus Paceibacteria bacterium]